MESEPGKKRFAISREERPQELARAFQETFYELKQEHPEIIGAALFGSLVKGSDAPGDVDACLFINPELLQEELPKVLSYKRRKFTLNRSGQLFAAAERYAVLTHVYDEKYRALFWNEFKQKVHSNDRRLLEHLIPIPLSERIINTMLDEIIESYRKHPEGVKEYAIRFTAGEEKDTGDAFNPDDARIEPSTLLYELFHLGMGEDIRQYRKIILDRLSNEGEIGEKVWRSIATALESWEQRVRFSEVPTKVHYPRTLKEAIEIYG